MRKVIFSLFLISCLMTGYTAGARQSESTVEEVSGMTESEIVENPVSETTTATTGETPADKKHNLVYVFPIREDIMPSTARLTRNCLERAREIGADIIIIDMNTYGGVLNAADSVRTMLLSCDIPVFTFINNQAASAGALIAIATDSIYMRPGASIGAATVVDQQGAALPDKYQSFMRSMMRSTAEAHGKVATTDVRGDTVWVWRRNPQIAQAMVDPSVMTEALPDSTKVITFTPEEASRWGYCEGIVSSVPELLDKAGVENYQIVEYKRTWLDRLLGLLTNPAAQSIFIMLIIGGIYFELQTPGIGFPLAVAILGALLYFAPLYMEGLLAYWEIILFVVGVILILIEIFAIPGFGVLGILGIIAVIAGLVFALIDTSILRYVPVQFSVGIVLRPVMMVVFAASAGLVLSIWLGSRLLKGRSRLRERLVLDTGMTAQEGYVAREHDRNLTGLRATTFIPLRPTGKVILEGRIYEAAAENGGFIEKGVSVIITRDEGGILYCREG